MKVSINNFNHSSFLPTNSGSSHVNRHTFLPSALLVGRFTTTRSFNCLPVNNNRTQTVYCVLLCHLTGGDDGMLSLYELLGTFINEYTPASRTDVLTQFAQAIIILILLPLLLTTHFAR